MSKCSFSPFPPSENHRFLEPSSLLPGRKHGAFRRFFRAFAAQVVIFRPKCHHFAPSKQSLGAQKMLSEFQNSPSEKAKNGAKRLIFAQKLGGCLSRKGPNLPFCLLETAKIASPPSILPSHFCTICPSEIFTLFHFSPFFLSALPVLSSPSSAALAKKQARRCPLPHAPTALLPMLPRQSPAPAALICRNFAA